MNVRRLHWWLETEIRRSLFRFTELETFAVETGKTLHWDNYICISFHIICHLNMIVLWCTVGFRGALNWTPLMSRDVSLSDSYKSERWRFSCLTVFLHWENFISISFGTQVRYPLNPLNTIVLWGSYKTT